MRNIPTPFCDLALDFLEETNNESRLFSPDGLFLSVPLGAMLISRRMVTYISFKPPMDGFPHHPQAVEAAFTRLIYSILSVFLLLFCKFGQKVILVDCLSIVGANPCF